MGSSGDRRPLLSIRCEAKMVLMRVDLPSPVCPARSISATAMYVWHRHQGHTNADYVKLETPLDELLLNL